MAPSNSQAYRLSMTGSDGKRVLTVGLTCIDIINVSDGFPVEDTDVRLKAQLWNRGGNAGNSAVVLAQLGTQTSYLGTLARHKLSDFIVEDLQKYGVVLDHCRYHDNTITPTTCVIVNAGTRTILSAIKTLPELCVEDFEKVNLKDYQWIHFEGRNIDQVLLMIDRIEVFNKEQSTSNSSTDKACKKRITVSVEIEKPRRLPNAIKLIHKADVVFISKDIAKHYGHESAEACVRGFYSQLKTRPCIIVCAWGELGASAIDADGNVVHSPAFPPAKVVDTLGAGDTFNAGVIHSLNRGESLLEAITSGCKVAGEKCGHHGFEISTHNHLAGEKCGQNGLEISTHNHL